MSKNKYTGAVIADIHAGAFSGEILYNELLHGFIKHLKSMDKLDFVIIAGDLFDIKIKIGALEIYPVIQLLIYIIFVVICFIVFFIILGCGKINSKKNQLVETE